ncbi:hypothetical protein ACLKA6_017603 [Drosophila palustris]
MVTPGNITVTGSDLLKEASRIRGFSGRDDYDLSSFLREVDTVLELFRENANTRLFVIQRYVVTKIHGEALNVIRPLGGNSTWEAIKAELIRNFGVKESYHHLYHRAISIRNTNPARRLPFHPHRRSSRKLPRFELDAAMTDVLELSTSPILDPAVEAGLTPPPTVSPGSAGTVFRWPERQQQQAEQEQQPEEQEQQPKEQQQQPEQEPEQQQQPEQEPEQEQQKQRPKQQKQPPAQQQPTLSLPTQPTTLPTAQPARPLVQLPAQQQPAAARPLAQPAALPTAQPALPMVQLPAVPAAQPRAQPAAPLPIRPLTPTIIVVMDSDEEPARPRYDPVVRREVPMTPGRGLSLEARPPGPKQFDELIGIAWPSEDIQRSLLPQDQLSSPCFGRTFSDPCCRRINSAVFALAGHPAILAAAGLTQQSLLWQDIQRSLLPQD